MTYHFNLSPCPLVPLSPCPVITKNLLTETYWERAGRQSLPQVNASTVIKQSPAIPKLFDEVTPDPWTLPTVDREALPAEQIIKQQMLLPAAPAQIATLEWILRNLPPAEIYAAEIPDAIAMAKSKLPKAAQIVELATRQQLIDCGIRRCKKLASQLKIRRYNVMKLGELADTLLGKIKLSDLIADSKILA